ncbi:MAG: ABC-2 transporter permease [Oscillospiraceae bacterium]|nr:ABC-2 transporter permease [Oscillospiraceae bacterium]
MKALLLKELYLLWKNCKIYLILMAVFFAVSVFQPESSFFRVYPCLYTGLLPITLLGLDENSRWDRYCDALPLTRAQMVSAKYLVGLCFPAVTALLSLVMWFFRGDGIPGKLLWETGVILAVALIPSALTLPVLFRLGVQKGRIVTYLVIGAICGGSVVMAKLLTGDAEGPALPSLLESPLLPALSAALYAASWLLSARFYRRREL